MNSITSPFARTLVLALTLFAAFGVTSLHGQDIRSSELNTQFHRAKTAWQSGSSLLEAKARIDRVLQENPEDVEALKLRTSILMGLGRGEDAMDDALQAVKLKPRDGETQLLLCETAQINKNETLAKQALKTASDLMMDNIQFLVRLSSCALSVGEFQRAESLARIAAAQSASDPRGTIQLARVFVRSNRLDAAVSILNKLVADSNISEKAIMNDPEFAAVYADRKN